MKVSLYTAQGAQDRPPSDLVSLLTSDAGTVWVDMTGPTEEDVRTMRDVFHFHPLAIEDTRNQRQRPKVEEYPDHIFVILNTTTAGQDELAFRELDVFVGRNFIVTVHMEDEPVIDEARKRLGHAGPSPTMSPGYLLYVLVDVVVDSYFPILDEIGEDIEELGNLVLTKPSRESLNSLFQLRRTLLILRRVIGPQRDMFNVLTRRDLAFIDQKALQYYLRDVYDHLLRITDMVDTFRDALTSTVDLYMSAVSNRLNQIVNRLTVITVIIGTLGVISGFYGMNFERTWPPFTAFWGVTFTLGLMAFVTGTLLFMFRRAGWY